MHEMGIAEGILAVAIDVAGGERVERVRVRVGALQRVTQDSLRFCFELAARDTTAANAVLEVDEVATRLRCRPCAIESPTENETFACSECHSIDVELIAGDELIVDAVKVASRWLRRPQSRVAVEAN